MSTNKIDRDGIVILGKSSFVGARLVSRLETTSDCSILTAGREECDLLNSSSVKDFFIKLGQLNCTVVLLACVNKWVENSYSSYVQNVAMAKNTVDAVLASKLKVKSLIFASSVDVYGNHPQLPITEETDVKPDSWYALGKYVSEWIYTSQLKNANYPVAILRLPGIYGAAAQDRSVIGSIIRRIQDDQKVYLTGGGSSRRDYVFIDDVCRVIEYLTTVPYDGVVNMASGVSLPLIDVVRNITDTLDIKANLVKTPANPDRDFDLIFDTTLFMSVLPEFQFANFEIGISSYIQ